MTDKERVQISNFAFAEDLKRRHCLIQNGILSEFVYNLLSENPNPSPSYVRKKYVSVFGEDELFSHLLSVALMTDSKVRIPYLDLHETTVSCITGQLPLSATNELIGKDRSVTIITESDFRSVCEAVSSDRVEFGVLPYCSSHAGYYPTYSRLAASYDLKICKTANVQKSDNDEEITFALYSKNLLRYKSFTTCVFSFTPTTSTDLSQLVSALNTKNLGVKSINSRPLEYNMDRYEYTAEILLGDYPLRSFISFLEMAIPSHNVLGTY